MEATLKLNRTKYYAWTTKNADCCPAILLRRRPKSRRFGQANNLRNDKHSWSLEEMKAINEICQNQTPYTDRQLSRHSTECQQISMKKEKKKKKTKAGSSLHPEVRQLGVTSSDCIQLNSPPTYWDEGRTLWGVPYYPDPLLLFCQLATQLKPHCLTVFGFAFDENCVTWLMPLWEIKWQLLLIWNRGATGIIRIFWFYNFIKLWKFVVLTITYQAQ